jgi:hypothetical protein
MHHDRWPAIIIARQIATERAKAQLAARGVRLPDVRAAEIKRLANGYLDQHGEELLAEANAIIEASPALRKSAERINASVSRITPNASKVPCVRAPTRSIPYSINRQRLAKQIEDTLRPIQKTPRQRGAKMPASSKRRQYDLWPTESGRYPYRTSQ